MAGCKSCGTKGVAGCNSNGGCLTGGCNKMNVFDWLSNMDMPVEDTFEIVEVRFKNGRKDFFKKGDVPLTTGDSVIVDVPNGHHLGYVSLQGELVRLQMQKKKIMMSDVRGIYRIATERDLEKYEEVKARDLPTLFRTREIIRHSMLDMKLSDVEFQADNTKATFYYSSEDRVDFRDLIKSLASEFRIRVEMRQISLRQEAGRLGGLGSCGRELCCSTWLSDFRSVSTSAARYQSLSLNPSKLSGQCGRLKCCLNYELDTYMDALRTIPKIDHPLLTSKGEARLQKTDIFKQTMWFGYSGENIWHPVSAIRVKEIVALNKKDVKPESLLENHLAKEEVSQTINSDLELLDKKFQKKGGGQNKRRKKRRRPNKPSSNV